MGAEGTMRCCLVTKKSLNFSLMILEFIRYVLYYSFLEIVAKLDYFDNFASLATLVKLNSVLDYEEIQVSF